jgi:hypothetical protein
LLNWAIVPGDPVPQLMGYNVEKLKCQLLAEFPYVKFGVGPSYELAHYADGYNGFLTDYDK